MSALIVIKFEPNEHRVSEKLFDIIANRTKYGPRTQCGGHSIALMVILERQIVREDNKWNIGQDTDTKVK